MSSGSLLCLLLPPSLLRRKLLLSYFFFGLVPVALVAQSPFVLIVNPSVPARTVQELIALAKTLKLTYASSGIGGSNHLTAELFKHMAGVNVVRVVYKGPVFATSALLAGEEVQMQFAPPTTARRSSRKRSRSRSRSRRS